MNPTMIEKATDYAREVSENGMMFVYERNGVYWLAVRVELTGGYRTLAAVGCGKFGIRLIRASIAEYFEDK